MLSVQTASHIKSQLLFPLKNLPFFHPQALHLLSTERQHFVGSNYFGSTKGTHNRLVVRKISLLSVIPSLPLLSSQVHWQGQSWLTQNQLFHLSKPRFSPLQEKHTSRIVGQNGSNSSDRVSGHCTKVNFPALEEGPDRKWNTCIGTQNVFLEISFPNNFQSLGARK